MSEVSGLRVSDNDTDTITVTLEGREMCSWSYADQDERRVKVSHARYFVDGWFAASKLLVKECRDEAMAAPDQGFRCGLLIAASIIRRGRRLTETEKRENLLRAIFAEEDSGQ